MGKVVVIVVVVIVVSVKVVIFVAELNIYIQEDLLLESSVFVIVIYR